MKLKILLLLVQLILFTNEIYGNVDSRLVYVSNTYDSPSLGKGTLVFDVEASSDTGDVLISYYGNSIKLDANFSGQNPLVSFSDQFFSTPDYSVTQEYINTNIKFVYDIDSAGTRKTLISNWTKIVRISIEYDMANVTTSLSWNNSLYAYMVTNEDSLIIVGNREDIPAELTNVPLPVELTGFNAKLVAGNSAKLDWQTATEVNNYGFEVERSNVKNQTSNEMEWEKIGFVEGAGNSNSPKIYSFVDNNLLGGSRFAYRLKQIDVDGSYTYSGEVEINVVPTKYELYQNYPNPFNPTTIIRFTLKKPEKVNIKIFNSLGQEIETLVNKNFSAGTHEINFNPDYLSSGIYIYRLQAGKFKEVRKMILLR
ncbi:hypothetical protein BMS3Abin04_01528 [bacterium BMS3Abin04]|nr:hypothetical protein BMS3Abin04_01528 [bacterium BMS3Abin04]